MKDLCKEKECRVTLMQPLDLHKGRQEFRLPRGSSNTLNISIPWIPVLHPAGVAVELSLVRKTLLVQGAAQLPVHVCVKD